MAIGPQANTTPDSPDYLLEREVQAMADRLGLERWGDVSAAGSLQQVAPSAEALARWTNRDLARFIDHTILKPDATASAVEQLCTEALEFGFATVCVNPDHVERCKRQLAGSRVGIATVVGFALGATTARIKALEAAECIALGASELDMVMNIGRLKDRDFAGVREDVRGVVEAASGRPVKVIIEATMLSVEEKIAACLLCREAGASFVKTSTGLNGGGATTEDVRLMRQVVGAAMSVKAAGGIRDAASARAMLAAGANRLGTSSALAIMSET